jgi:hypothetical protein
LTGEVTFAKQARHFQRQGQLRFLFESVQAPDRTPEQLLASLVAVESAQGDRLSIDRLRGYANPMQPTNMGNELDDETVEARPASVWYRLSKVYRRNRTAVVTASGSCSAAMTERPLRPPQKTKSSRSALAVIGSA